MEGNNPIEDLPIIEEKIPNVMGNPVIKRYAKGKFLGKGGFARCYEFTNQETKQLFASKIIPKASLKKSRHRQKLLSEIKIHRSLNHRNIVKFEHVFEDSQNVYILLELCTNQTLNDLCKRRKRLSEFEAQYYIFQMCNALKYLHKNRVIHRDLKLGNLFLNEKLKIKLGDFGLAAKLDFDSEKRHTVCGTPNYLAPEVLQNKVGHSYEVDIWSMGVVLYALIIGKPPFETPEVKMTYEKIRKGIYSFPEHIKISNNAKDLITKIFNLDPSKRPSLDQIIDHPFLNGGVGIAKSMHISTLAMKPNKSMMEQLIGEEPVQNNVNVQMALSTSKKNDSNQTKSEIYVKKWVDYSSKYGLGYLLSNGCSGVFFNDYTKIIFDPKNEYFEYLDRQNNEKNDHLTCYRLKSYPRHLHKKVTLLLHFRSYLESIRPPVTYYTDDAEEVPMNARDPPMIYLKKWMKTRHASLLRLSNKIVQVAFTDKTEIILSSESKMVTYVNKKGERQKFPITNALESDNSEMSKRLKYTKEILTHMLNNRRNQQLYNQ